MVRRLPAVAQPQSPGGKSVMLTITLLLLSSAAAPAQARTHEELNPVYKSLREDGLQYTERFKQPLPAPVMADGLNAAQQLAVIKKLAGEDYSVAELLRKSVVAPQILRINKIDPSDPKNPARIVEAYFVAYGDMKKIANKTFLDRLITVSKNQGQGKSLDAKELAQRGIQIDPRDQDFEGYGWAKYDLFDKVRIATTGRSYWSQTPDSIVIAMHMDPRFRKDAVYPNQWRSLTKKAGQLSEGPPVPYDGAGSYMKITRLAEPVGALFVESVIGFSEPSGWFNETNMLRPKLPPVLQSQIRTIRGELLKQSEK